MAIGVEGGRRFRSVLVMKKFNFLGVDMHDATMEETVSEIASRLDANIVTQHVVVNVAKLVQAQTDAQLLAAIASCEIVNIDGMGVVWGARWLGFPVTERVAGIDLFLRLLRFAEERQELVYFLGARESVLDQAVANIKTQYPKIRIAGSHHGYFGDSDGDVVENIRQSGASMLFVAMSSPLKEEFIAKWRDRLGVKFMMGVGGSFDVIAGKTKRAPSAFQRLGLEWFYRLVQEPRRMWRRYLFTNLAFAKLLLREKLRVRPPDAS